MTTIKHRICHMAAVAQHEGRRSRRSRLYELRCDREWRFAVDWIQWRQVNRPMVR